MPTQEERLAALEEITREYRPVLQNFAYELTMVKGLIIDQTGITQELRRDMSDVRKRLDQIETLLTQEFRQDMSNVRKRLDQIETLLTQILARLPGNP